jgi:hypothetical protein
MNFIGGLQNGCQSAPEIGISSNFGIRRFLNKILFGDIILAVLSFEIWITMGTLCQKANFGAVKICLFASSSLSNVSKRRGIPPQSGILEG